MFRLGKKPNYEGNPSLGLELEGLGVHAVARVRGRPEALVLEHVPWPPTSPPLYMCTDKEVCVCL